MRGEPVVTGLDRFETLRGFPCRDDDHHRLEPRCSQSSRGGFGVARGHVAIRNDSAPTPELQSRAFFAESPEESRADLNLIAASPKGHIDGAHKLRIGNAALLSKLSSPSEPEAATSKALPLSNVDLSAEDCSDLANEHAKLWDREFRVRGDGLAVRTENHKLVASPRIRASKPQPATFE